jgi:hypothetical protein
MLMHQKKVSDIPENELLLNPTMSSSRRGRNEPSNAEKCMKIDTCIDEVDEKYVGSLLSMSSASEVSASFKLQVDDGEPVESGDSNDSNDVLNESKEVNVPLSDDEQEFFVFPLKVELVECADGEANAVEAESYKSAMLSSSAMLEKFVKQRLENAIKEDERAKELHKVNLKTAQVNHRIAMLEWEIASRKLQQMVNQQH